MMKHILLPTDFSENAKNAYRFATALAKKFDAKLSVIHIYNPGPEVATFDGLSMQAVTYTKGMVESLKRKLNTFVNLAPSNEKEAFVPASNLETAVLEGIVVTTVSYYVENEGVDMVVMGTKGESDWSSKLFGSITANVINNVSCPVLAVPKEAQITAIKEICYATSLKANDKNKVDKLSQYSKSLGSTLKVVYVDDRMSNAGDFRDEDFNRAYFYKNIGSSEIPFEVVWSADINKGIRAYFKENDIDVMALTRSKFGFWRRLFNQSITQELMKDVPFPLLILHDD